MWRGANCPIFPRETSELFRIVICFCDGQGEKERSVTLVSRRLEPSMLGCITTCLFYAACVGIVVILIRGYWRPYERAMRIRDSDPCKAVRLFGEEVRLNQKTAIDAVHQLTHIHTKCAIAEIVRLMDLPEGRNTGPYIREMLWKNLQSRAALISKSFPIYDPDASLQRRKREQAQWFAWLAKHKLKRIRIEIMQGGQTSASSVESCPPCIHKGREIAHEGTRRREYFIEQ